MTFYCSKGRGSESSKKLYKKTWQDKSTQPERRMDVKLFKITCSAGVFENWTVHQQIMACGLMRTSLGSVNTFHLFALHCKAHSKYWVICSLPMLLYYVNVLSQISLWLKLVSLNILTIEKAGWRDCSRSRMVEIGSQKDLFGIFKLLCILRDEDFWTAYLPNIWRARTYLNDP